MSNPNLIRNGTFSSGKAGFSSTFQYVNPNPKHHTVPGQYSVISDPATQFHNNYLDYGDHTTGSGKMLFVDGTSSGAFWSESVSLAANTTYSFTYFATAADAESLAEIGLSLNGSSLDSFQITGTGGGGQWQRVTASFTTSASGTATVALTDLNNTAEGNDFDIDDISLRHSTRAAPAGTNLLRDGNFSAAKPGFSSDYTYVAPNTGVSTGVGDYSVITKPSTAFTNGYDSYGDHTTGSGEMLFVDGSSSGAFWREAVSLAAHTTYSFSYFVTGADGSNLPNIKLELNGAAIDAGFQVTADGGASNWQNVVETFTTTSAGAYTLALTDNSGTAEGNDFTLDDLKLVQATTPATPTATSSYRAKSEALIQAVAGFEGRAIGAGGDPLEMGTRAMSASLAIPCMRALNGARLAGAVLA